MINDFSKKSTKIIKGVPLRCPRMGWVGQGQHQFWRRILLCKIRNV
jgi:hypothetical protein